MVTRSSMVCSLLFDFHHSFAMTPAFFCASLFAMTLALLVNGEMAADGLVVILDVLGLVGERKTKAAVANGNGVQ